MKTIGIYPLQGQPPHLGYKKAYEKLKHYAGPDTFVVTTDFDPSVKAPLHFGDKEQILARHNIPSSHIKKVKDLKNPIEVLDNFDPETTVVIFAMNKTEASRILQSNPYFKSFTSSESHLLPFKHHSYIIIVDDSLIAKDKEGKQKVYTSKNIREALGSHRFTKNQKEKWFKTFFGWFDLGLFELLKNKYTHAHQSDVFEPTEDLPDENGNNKFSPTTETMKEILAKEIISILNELMSSPPSIATDGSFGPDSIATDKDAFDTSNEPTMSDLNKEKRAAIDQKTANQTQFKRDTASVKNYRQNIKNSDEEKIKSINQKISNFNKDQTDPLIK